MSVTGCMPSIGRLSPSRWVVNRLSSITVVKSVMTLVTRPAENLFMEHINVATLVVSKIIDRTLSAVPECLLIPRISPMFVVVIVTLFISGIMNIVS